ncbi:MAG: WYL domain-containing protein [Clostridia bacterium]|nr:WYL domain-containing protein [Clostridia bacterium]
MARSEGQKLKLFALKEILENETDDSHGITMARILELLSMRGIKAERKSIYDDLRTLRESDILDLVGPQGQNRTYSVGERVFQLSELKMMIDALQSSKFLSEKTTRDLIKKLESFCSKYEAKELHRQVVLANRVKNISSSSVLFRTIDAIHRAITANAQVSFQYFDYDLKKQKHYMKKGERYVVSPWAMIYTDDNYYLLAYTEGKFKHFRVDRMDKAEAMITEIAEVEVASLAREGAEEFAKKDMSAYTKYTFSMFGGETVPVTMVFQNRMMGAVMDRFGRDVVAMKEDERHFRVTVSVAVSNQFYGWVFGLGKAVRIIGPECVKEGMKKALADIAARYED